jgi:hypothetical protein
MAAPKAVAGAAPRREGAEPRTGCADRREELGGQAQPVPGSRLERVSLARGGELERLGGSARLLARAESLRWPGQ